MTATLPSLSDSRIPTDTLRLVFDCPRCVWRDFGVTGLDWGFDGEHPDRLAETGRELVRQPLIEVWREHGYVAVLVCHDDHTDASDGDEPSDEEFAVVRQAAVDRIPYGIDFAAAAGLEREYRDHMGGER